MKQGEVKGESRAGQLGLVLVANDHEWTARSVESILVAAGYGVVRTFTGRETLDIASSRRPDVFILDHQLPDFSGLEVCRLLREDPSFGSSTPIMITTAGPSGRTQRLAAYEAGAWEFYGQPLDGEALLHKVRVFLESRREVSRLALAGLIDTATGLYNREGLMRRAEELAADARRRGGGIACVAVSAPEPGEESSTSRLIEAIQGTARVNDAKGRVSPGAFAVIGATDAEGAGRMAVRLREAMGGSEDLRIAVASSDAEALLTLSAGSLIDRAMMELAAA